MPFEYPPDVYNTASAAVIVPVVLGTLSPRSVVDFGCGNGAWLSVFKAHGVVDVVGIDSGGVSEADWLAGPGELDRRDVETTFSLGKRYDLVVALEVAEHLSESRAAVFVNNLVAHGDVILFSASLPGQEGQGHRNEQWPSYWVSLFAQHGYQFYDLIRPMVWENPKVHWWYRQNIFVVSCRQFPRRAEMLGAIHPDLYKMKLAEIERLRARLECLEAGGFGSGYYGTVLVRHLLRIATRITMKWRGRSE
jgi:hypothetical protein